MKNLILILTVLTSLNSFANQNETDHSRLDEISQQERQCLQPDENISNVEAEECLLQTRIKLDALLFDLKERDSNQLGSKTNVDNYSAYNSMYRVYFSKLNKLELLTKQRTVAVQQAANDWEGGSGQGRAKLQAYNDKTQQMILFWLNH